MQEEMNQTIHSIIQAIIANLDKQKAYLLQLTKLGHIKMDLKFQYLSPTHLKYQYLHSNFHWTMVHHNAHVLKSFQLQPKCILFSINVH